MEDELLTKEQIVYLGELQASVFADYSKTNYDKNRKHNIIKLLEFYRDINSIHGARIAVNKMYQLHTKYDKDIQTLLRSNKIKITREGNYHSLKGNGWKRRGSNQTYIVLNV